MGGVERGVITSPGKTRSGQLTKPKESQCDQE